MGKRHNHTPHSTIHSHSEHRTMASPQQTPTTAGYRCGHAWSTVTRATPLTTRTQMTTKKMGLESTSPPPRTPLSPLINTPDAVHRLAVSPAATRHHTRTTRTAAQSSGPARIPPAVHGLVTSGAASKHRRNRSVAPIAQSLQFHGVTQEELDLVATATSSAASSAQPQHGNALIPHQGYHVVKAAADSLQRPSQHRRRSSDARQNQTRARARHSEIKYFR